MEAHDSQYKVKNADHITVFTDFTRNLCKRSLSSDN